jgi:hypothetical protein
VKHDEASLKSAILELSSAGTHKFKTAKALVALSDKHPDRLYPYFDAFCGLLETKNSIIKWAAFQIVANLAVVDKECRIEGIIDGYLAPIAGPVMVTAANAIIGSARIARTHRHLSNRIVRGILLVEHATYQTDECRNVAIGHAIRALGMMETKIRRTEDIMGFVERQTQNTRASTRKKAELFLKGIRKEPQARP